MSANICTTIKEYHKVTGLPLKGDLTKIENLSEDIKENMIKRMKLEAQVLKKNSSTINTLKAFEKVFSCRLSEDSWGLLDPKNIIEIYDFNFCQWYRNWTFYKISSYSLEQLCMYPIWELYNRPTEITNKIVNEVMSLTQNDFNHTVPFEIPIHRLRELNPEKNNNGVTFNVDFKTISPVFDVETNEIKFVLTQAYVRPMGMLQKGNEDYFYDAASLSVV
ncbi:MAG: hypothetical protein KDD50_04500 [Bdellovibrionales bacterium]|nr:hypothetical protein [Bdellovibrionales bacterium]